MPDASALNSQSSLPDDLAQVLASGKKHWRCWCLFQAIADACQDHDFEVWSENDTILSSLEEVVPLCHELSLFDELHRFEEEGYSRGGWFDERVMDEVERARKKYIGGTFSPPWNIYRPLAAYIKSFSSGFEFLDVLIRETRWAFENSLRIGDALGSCMIPTWRTKEGRDNVSIGRKTLSDHIRGDEVYLAIFAGHIEAIPDPCWEEDSLMESVLEIEIAAVLRLRDAGLSWNTIGLVDDAKYAKPMSPAQIAKLFGVSWDTVKRRFDERAIRHKKLSSKSYRIHLDDLPSQ